jgi:hypothetical protein
MRRQARPRALTAPSAASSSASSAGVKRRIQLVELASSAPSQAHGPVIGCAATVLM